MIALKNIPAATGKPTNPRKKNKNLHNVSLNVILKKNLAGIRKKTARNKNIINKANTTYKLSAPPEGICNRKANPIESTDDIKPKKINKITLGLYGLVTVSVLDI